MQEEAGRVPAHAAAEPSQWVRRWAPAIAAGGEVLDLACGRGRHSLLLARLGFRVCAVDRDAQSLAALAGSASVATLQADLERDAWPLAGRRFQGVVVANYLHRPLFGHILDALAPAGVLVYETFAAGNERFGKPSNPDFLLRPGELLEVVRGHLRVLAYEDLEVSEPAPAMIQRICARRETSQP
ncbi:MAG TPA: methyltransferase domain-containing protein [Burkholderiales bacterium]|nr:methyltransferase domain-containing protein [Burkholderiales bacterium]